MVTQGASVRAEKGVVAATANRVARTLTSVAAHVVDAQVCTWTDSPDHRFVIDRLPDGVVVAFGDSGEGFKFSALMGLLLADLAENRTADADVATFGAGRFAGGADPEGFHGRELLDEHVIEADLVLTATRDHRAQVISMGHAAGLRTFTLKEFTRLVRAIDPATLPDGGVIERARALVRAAAALRGWLQAPSAEADEVYDPYGAPVTVFRHIGEEIHDALVPMVTALTGVPAVPGLPRPPH